MDLGIVIGPIKDVQFSLNRESKPALRSVVFLRGDTYSLTQPTLKIIIARGRYTPK